MAQRSYDVLNFDDEDNEHEDVADWNNSGDLSHDSLALLLIIAKTWRRCFFFGMSTSTN